MIQIAIKSTGEYLDLPKDLKLSIELTNPLFSEQGSASLPLTLPATSQNRRLLGYVTTPQLESANVVDSIKVVITTDFIPSWEATLTILSHNFDTISAALLFRESEAYSKMDEQMSSIFDDDAVWKKDFAYYGFAYGSYNHSGEKALVIAPVKSDDVTVSPYNASYALKYNARSETIGDLTVSIPAGYMITGHLYLGFVIKRIFEYLGYVWNSSIFSYENNAEGHIVILNNNIDSFFQVGGNYRILYRHLVPTCTISEFLKAVGVQFGGAFFFNLDNTVEFKTYNELFTSSAQLNLSERIKDVPTVTLSEKKHLALTSKKLTDDDQPLEITSVKEIMKYADRRGTEDPYATISRLPAYGSNAIKQSGIYRLMPDNNFYVIHKSLQSSAASSINNPNYGYSMPVSSRITLETGATNNNNTDWGGGEYSTTQFYQAGQSPSSGTPAAQTFYLWSERLCPDNLDWIPDVDDDQIEKIEGDFVTVMMKAVHNSYYQMSECLPYVGPHRQMTTDIMDSSGNIVEGEGECPIMFAIADQCYPSTFGTQHQAMMLSVTCNKNKLPFPPDVVPISRSEIDMYSLAFGGEGGVYDRLYKTYDRLLQTSWNDMNIPLRLSATDIISFQFGRKMMVYNTPVIPISLKIEITDNTCEVVDSTFKTMI